MIAAGVTPVHSAEELYRTCNVVSLHIPATAETKQSINYALLSQMPKGAVLVNTARKEVINEDELIQLMQERADFKYVTDIMPAADMKFKTLFITGSSMNAHIDILVNELSVSELISASALKRLAANVP